MPEQEQISSPENEPSELIFEYGIKEEKERILWTIQKSQWYEENGYHIAMPGNLEMSEALKLNNDELRELIEREYKPEDYQQIQEKISAEWRDKLPVFKVGLSKMGIVLDPEYKIILSKYGTGGSYNSHSRPKSVNINFMSRKIARRDDVTEILCHEIVHLCTQDWVEKYKVPHWSKEHLIDLMMKFIFQKGWMQRIDEDVAEKIDAIFENHKENIEEVFRLVGQLETAKN